MFQHDQPFPTDLSITIGNPHPPIDRTPLLVGTRNMLTAVTKPKISAHSNTQLSNGNLRLALKMREKIHPISAIGVSAKILLPRHNIKNDQAAIRYVVPHDRVDIAGIKGCYKPVLKRAYRRLIIQYGNFRCFHIANFNFCTPKQPAPHQ